MSLGLRYLAALTSALCALGALRYPGPWAPRLLLLLMASPLAWLAARKPRPLAPLQTHLAAIAGVGLALFAAEVAYIHVEGLTDHRQPARVIVVFGAKVHEDGTPSEALLERVTTGVELYRQGLSPTLLVSGGIGREGQDEAAVMKRIATSQGVPEEAIVTDNQGANTEASLRAVRDFLATSGGGKALVVSHYHHLPRIRLLGRFHGVECLTVPAEEGATMLKGTPYYVAREAAALAFYFLRG